MSVQPQACPQCSHPIPKERAQDRFCARCRFPLVIVANKYRLVRTLAEGGFGTVFLAEHIHLKEDHSRVIKVMKPEIMKLPGMETRFFREVRITSSLSQKNEHIVRIYDDFGKEEELGYYYVMEYLHGHPLSHRLQRGALSPEEIFHIFEQLSMAIAEAHRASIVHRDLKPDNIMLVHNKLQHPHVKVLDFGIAKPMDQNSQPNLTQGMLGTPAYMSPEQCLGQEIGPQTDIYAIGVILYELFTGSPPFGGLAQSSQSANSFMAVLHAHITQKPPPLRPQLPHIPKNVERSLMRALEKKPEKRFSDMEAFYHDLAPLMSDWTGIPMRAKGLLNDPIQISTTASDWEQLQMIPSGDALPAIRATNITHNHNTTTPRLSRGLLAGLLALIFILLGGLGLALYFLYQAQHPQITPNTQNPLAKLKVEVPVQTTPSPALPDASSPKPPDKPTLTTPVPNKTKPNPPKKRILAVKKRALVTPPKKRKRRKRRKRRVRRKKRRRIARLKTPTIDPELQPPTPSGTGLNPEASKAINSLALVGRQLLKATRAKNTRRSLRLARKAIRRYDDLLMVNIPHETKTRIKNIPALAHFVLSRHSTRRFRRLQFYAQNSHQARQEYTRIMQGFTRHVQRVSKLYSFYGTPFYTCAFLFSGNSYEHLSQIMEDATMGPSAQHFAVYQRVFAKLIPMYKKLAHTQYRSGLRFSGRQRNPMCLKGLRRSFKRTRPP